MKMTTLYISLAILCAALQILFIFLLTKQGRKEALQETENNLTEVFKNLDSTSKKEFLLDANLNKDEIIYLVNNQSKSSAVEIISTTIKEFEIIQKDLDKKGEKLEDINNAANTIVKTQKDNANSINPKDLLIDVNIDVDNQTNTANFLNKLTEHNNSFKIWISFIQDDIEIYTYFDSMGKWEIDSSMEGTVSNGHPYMILVSTNRLKITKGKLIIFNNNAKKVFTADKEIEFKVHYTGNSENLNLDFYNFIIIDKNGFKVKPYNLSKEKISLSNSILVDPNRGFFKNTIVLSGTFKLK